MLNSVELFAGAGGLAMGVSLAGFESKAVVEWDKWACDTIRENSANEFPIVNKWPLYEADVRDFDFGSLEDKIDLVAGGPPCQPFSLGGKHRANQDVRDMFPVTVDAIRRLRPKAFIVENVRGLTRASFSNYFQYLLLQLSYPEMRQRHDEDTIDHLSRLERVKTSGRRAGLTYEVVFRVVNAADYGVPQKRERVFIVGFRNNLGIKWSFPNETHSYEALLEEQWVTGSYWDRHQIPMKKRPSIGASLSNRYASPTIAQKIAGCLGGRYGMDWSDCPNQVVLIVLFIIINFRPVQSNIQVTQEAHWTCLPRLLKPAFMVFLVVRI